jgi:heat shock protein HslJ
MVPLATVHIGSRIPATIVAEPMMRALLPLVLLTLAACTAPAEAPPVTESPAPRQALPAVATDDGSYLARIDPLGGQWRVERLGEEDFARFGGWVNFSAGGFLNHGAGCAGGHPAFYRLDGQRVTVTRIEPIRIGKCAGTQEMANASASARAEAGESERRLAAFLDRVTGWSRPGEHRLELVASDGRRALLTRPAEPHPDLAGRWIIESIGGEPLVTERRPPTLSISMNAIGVHADCNSMGSNFTIPAPGRFSVAGPIMGTAIGCAPEDQAEDDLMTRATREATGYRFEGARLVFTGGLGMVVRRPPPPDRRLAGEYEACGNTLLGAYHEGPITLTIDAATMRDNAGCTARYLADGPNLTLTLDDGPACARAVPPYVPGQPVGVGGEISALAVTRPDGFAFNEQGQLILRTNRGLLSMCRKGDPPPFGS